MAFKTPLNLLKKNSASIIAVIILLCSSPASAGKQGGHGGGDAKHGAAEAPKVEVPKGNFSKEQLDAMKQSQLLTYLANPNYQSSEYAVYYFEQKGEHGVPALLAYLKKNEDKERVLSAVIYTLGRVGKKASRAVPIVSKYLSHDNPDVQTAAIAALGKMGKASEPAVPIIADFLNNRNEWTRTLALRSLKEINTSQAKAIAKQYENNLKLQEERRKAQLLGK